MGACVESQTILEELRSALEGIPSSKVDKLLKEIGEIGESRVFVHGTGRTGLMLRAFAMRLMQLGYTAYVVGETTTPALAMGDVLIVASASGETESVVFAATRAGRDGVRVVSITGTKDGRLSSVVEPLVLLETGSKYEESRMSVQPLGSLFEQTLLLFLDACILRASCKTCEGNQAMARRHASLE